MNLWVAKVIILMASIVMVAIRAPHGQRRRGIPAVRSRKGKLEIVLLTIAWLAFFLPLVWIATPVLASADHALRPVPLLAGTVCLTLGLWLFHLSHADLGANWSITLEVLEKHRLVTQGVYRSVTRCTRLSCYIRWAKRSFFPTTWRARPTASRWLSSSPSALDPRSG